MNYKLVFNVLGKTFLIGAIFYIFPLIINFAYAESNYSAFLIPAAALLLSGFLLDCFVRPKDASMRPKEGFVIVALVWIILSLIGALPFVLSGEVKSYIDALFETVSGLTTTGASVIENPELLSKSLGFWRIFNHFLGGMGVLVFLLAILPGDNASAIHVLRAESPGPTSQKIVSKVRFTARILYTIYVFLTVLLTVLLLLGGMDFYNAVVHALSTAGTGGFSTLKDSVAGFNSNYVEIVIAVFMFLFGVNFNVFYLIILGKFTKAFLSEEFLVYLIINVAATFAIALNIMGLIGNFGDALRISFFQTASISSTTGFSVADFNTWPNLSQGIILILMIIGGCGGSTAGGIKVARLVILTKSSHNDLKKMMRPRIVSSAKFEGEPLDSVTVNSVRSYFIFWFAIVAVSALILSIDDFGGVIEDLTASLTCISNVGPGLGAVGPAGNFFGYGAGSKIALCFVMLAGRLEIFPLFALFNYKVWKKA